MPYCNARTAHAACLMRADITHRDQNDNYGYSIFDMIAVFSWNESFEFQLLHAPSCRSLNGTWVAIVSLSRHMRRGFGDQADADFPLANAAQVVFRDATFVCAQ